MKSTQKFAATAFFLLLIVMAGCQEQESISTPNVYEASYAYEFTRIDDVVFMSANVNTLMFYTLTPSTTGGGAEDWSYRIYDSELNHIKNIEHKLFLEGGWVRGFAQNPDNSFWLTEDALISLTDMSFQSYLRLFNPEGEDVLTINITEEYGVRATLIGSDSEGNAYFTETEGPGVPISLYVIDRSGTLIRKIDNQFMWFMSMATLDDGRVILLNADNQHNLYELTHDDVKKLYSFGAGEYYNNIFAGKDNSVYLTHDQYLYTFDLETHDMKLVASWRDMPGCQLDSLYVTPSGEIYGLIFGRLVRFVEFDNLSPTPEDQRTVIKVAMYTQIPKFTEWSIDFNAKSTEYKIEITDYSQYDTQDNIYGAIHRLSLDLMSGNPPDIFLWNFMGNFHGFTQETYAGKGVFADLGEFLNNDPELSRESFLPNLIEALETENGEIFELPIEFQANVISARKSDIPLDQWTLEEFLAVQAKRPEAYAAFSLSPEMLVNLIFQYSSEDFVDWNAGTCNFETEYFIKLLDFAKSQKLDLSKHYYALAHNNIDAGISYLFITNLGQVQDIQYIKATFGGDEINFIGFPTTHGQGNSFQLWSSLSIFNYSEHKELCWEIIRHFYTTDYQLANANFFPTNMDALDWRLNNPNEYIQKEYMFTLEAPNEFFQVVMTKATDDEIEQVKELIFSLDRIHRQNNIIRDIIYDSIGVFLNEQATGEQTAKIIQNRVSTYLAEQS